MRTGRTPALVDNVRHVHQLAEDRHKLTVIASEAILPYSVKFVKTPFYYMHATYDYENYDATMIYDDVMICRWCNGVLVNLQIEIDYKLIVVRIRDDQRFLCVSFLRGGSFSRPATSEISGSQRVDQSRSRT